MNIMLKNPCVVVDTNFKNRNLQAAVGFYLDYYSGMKLPSMQIISDVTIGEGEAITPNTP